MNSLRRSYRLCGKITRKQARNFFYAFLLLPQNRREALHAIYAFMRQSDDLVDTPNHQDKLKNLENWRKVLEHALTGKPTDSPIMPALVETVQHYSIPHHYFFELLDGMEMDLNKTRYETFDALYSYCYRVASVVGLVCAYVFGFKDKKALEYAEAAGIAFQLTNILRDIREDAAQGRIYIPLEDLKKFRYSEEQLHQGVVDDHFRRLLHFQIERARDYYHQGEALIPLVNSDCQKALSALIGIYRKLLEKIHAQDELVLEKSIRLSLFEKLSVVVQAWRTPSLVAGL